MFDENTDLYKTYATFSNFAWETRRGKYWSKKIIIHYILFIITYNLLHSSKNDQKIISLNNSTRKERINLMDSIIMRIVYNFFFYNYIFIITFYWN